MEKIYRQAIERANTLLQKEAAFRKQLLVTVDLSNWMNVHAFITVKPEGLSDVFVNTAEYL